MRLFTILLLLAAGCADPVRNTDPAALPAPDPHTTTTNAPVHPQYAERRGADAAPVRTDRWGALTVQAAFGDDVVDMVVDPAFPSTTLPGAVLTQLGYPADLWMGAHGTPPSVFVDAFSVGPHTWEHATFVLHAARNDDSPGTLGAPSLRGAVWLLDLHTKTLQQGDASHATLDVTSDLTAQGAIGGTPASVQIDLTARETRISAMLATDLGLVEPGRRVEPGDVIDLPAVQLGDTDVGTFRATVTEGMGDRVVLGVRHLAGLQLTLDLAHGRVGVQERSLVELPTPAFGPGTVVMVQGHNRWTACAYERMEVHPRRPIAGADIAVSTYRFACDVEGFVGTVWAPSTDRVRPLMSPSEATAVMAHLSEPFDVFDTDRRAQFEQARDLVKTGDPMQTARALRWLAALHQSERLSGVESRVFQAGVDQLCEEVARVRGTTFDAIEPRVADALGMRR